LNKRQFQPEIGEQKAFSEGLIEAYKNVELRIFEKFGLLKD
jgi:hypothetical protein